MRSFKDLMDALGLTAPEVAALLNRSPQNVYQMRLDPEHEGYRPPPEGWEAAFARYARERGGELTALADELEMEES